MKNYVLYNGYWWEYDPKDNLKEATLYNALGRRNSYCDIRFCKTAQANNFDELDWQGTKVYDNKKYLSGWLSPEGEFWGCDYRSHDILARYVLHRQTYQLEAQGFIKINYTQDGGSTKKYYIIIPGKHVPTNAQIKYLYDTFSDDKESWQEIIWSIRVQKISQENQINAQKSKDNQ